VFSINAEGTAPRLATIEWYEKNFGGKLPVNDSLLAGTVPGVIDAWFILLDRWGTKSFADVLQPAIEVAEQGFPLPEGLARSMSAAQLKKYPTSVALYQPGGRAPQGGDIFRNPDAGRMLETAKPRRPRRQGATRTSGGARSLQGRHRHEMAAFSEQNSGLFHMRLRQLYGEGGNAGLHHLPRLRRHKNPSASQGRPS
jgi:hypothetical protein